jgi:pilus assembly protein Flp/PilA
MLRYWFYKIKLNERGATAIEYGLIAALIALVAVGSISSVGSPVGMMAQQVADAFP